MPDALALKGANIVLRDAGITLKTQGRYFQGLLAILPILERSLNMLDMDEKVSDWIQASWEKGDSLHLVTMSLGHASSCHSLGRYSLFGGSWNPQTVLRP